jgi:putative FmdB family regulatory protein
MPIYEFYCGECEKAFELMRPFSEAYKPGKCPDCGKAGQKLVTNCASKLDFYVRPPAKAPFRGEISLSGKKPAGTKAKAGAKR